MTIGLDKKILLSAIRAKGLLMPAYSGSFYQPGKAIRLGKTRVVKNELVAR